MCGHIQPTNGMTEQIIAILRVQGCQMVLDPLLFMFQAVRKSFDHHYIASLAVSILSYLSHKFEFDLHYD